MAREIIWSAACFRDFEQIHHYIALDSPGYAHAFAEQILERVDWLRQNADMASMVVEFGDPAIREVLAGNYRILFRAKEDCIELLGLIHGARDFQKAIGKRLR
jgi:plasmid stabilization system protein ParE